MALSDKNIVITPNIGQASDPQIVFSGANASTGPQNITVRVTPQNQGTLSISGASGQIASYADLSTGSLFSIATEGGTILFDVDETGNIKLSLATGSLGLPSGTTAQRPNNPLAGYTRWNSERSTMEVYTGSTWVDLITDYAPSGSTIFG